MKEHMTKMTTGCLAVMLALISAGSLLAHHSLANYDTTKAVRVKGTIVQFHPINPHSFIFLEEKSADGQTHRWAVEGPSIIQLKRTGFATDVLKPGEVVEVCGYVPKEAVMWQIASADTTTTSPAGRLINAEMLVMPDGKQQSWGDYGVHKCFVPGYTDQHPSK
jgi:uncharacterized protein DUF6152